ncbi:DUF397 domain-containing protein [Streptomyces olivaceus]|uniref:DUF397 domain-containing protein n=1 Tax=Streptomyces olivaceus TaxID=47716 RepID=UPI001CC95BB3|nr:DUF397 domain-containing protein [Streptomyces olivaceus]MBZ6141891.1 DUF397 domain-containing protein [Streptomyces olivaceus]MBZ6165879.1 DUF397 domain-containing protein [Streptomyces olivaceus]
MTIDQARPAPGRMNWLKSSYSGTSGGDCVEVATTSATVHVRDSKHRTQPSISVGTAQWTAFVGFAADRTPERGEPGLD